MPSPTRRAVVAAAPVDPLKETTYEQIGGFVAFFILLLITKTFFLQLYEIPTGSMADTLRGEHAMTACSNCGFEFAVGPDVTPRGPLPPTFAHCVNCRTLFRNPERPPPQGVQPQEFGRLPALPMPMRGGDRIIVHGWAYEFPFKWLDSLSPQRWDVVVFKFPTEPNTNYIKRLIGLPGETIEMIDGDIFADGRIARKPQYAQHSLWMPAYLQDHRPKKPGLGDPGYQPRFVPQDESGGWSDLATRVLRFGGADRGRGTIRFVTAPGSDSAPGDIRDFYGYNVRPGLPGSSMEPANIVSDVRVGADVTLEGGDGYLELRVAKRSDSFAARLYADGRVTLLHAGPGGGPPLLRGETQIGAKLHGRRFALGVADYRAIVEIDDDGVISTDIDVTDEAARRLSKDKANAVVEIAAERVSAALSAVRIDRDVYYTNTTRDRPRPGNGPPGNANEGHPFRIPADACFVLGDNSPNSRDARYWGPDDVGPHLADSFAAGGYVYGTVPIDQLLGRAFFVYWPGSSGPGFGGFRLLPDTGRVRWIH